MRRGTTAAAAAAAAAAGVTADQPHHAVVQCFLPTVGNTCKVDRVPIPFSVVTDSRRTDVDGNSRRVQAKIIQSITHVKWIIVQEIVRKKIS